jgi:hypothetical protein
MIRPDKFRTSFSKLCFKSFCLLVWCNAERFFQFFSRSFLALLLFLAMMIDGIFNLEAL